MQDVVEKREAITLENCGEKIFGILHRPLRANRVPAIVICPGFMGTKTGKYRLLVSLGKELAKRGIAVLRFDYRGAGDSEGEFSDLTLEGETCDVLACLDFLARDSQVDSNRLGLLGRSLGGVIALLAARRHPVKSLALWSPVFYSDPWRELQDALNSSRQLDQGEREILRRLPAHAPNPEFLNQFFKLNLEMELGKLAHLPLLHIHGGQDQVVTMDHTAAYQKARLGVENTRFIQLPNGDHEFSDPIEQALAIQETCTWYQQTL